MFEYFRDGLSVSYQFQRCLIEMSGGAAALGECDWAGRQLTERFTHHKWVEVWNQLAERTEEIAVGCAARGHRISARDASLRAANYYRTADVFCPPANPRKMHLYDASLRCFARALPDMRHRAERIAIPFEGDALAGYFVHADGAAGGRRPVVVMVGGFDSVAEEIFILGAAAIAERGFHFLVFDGPGQGHSLRKRGLTARPDFEVPAAAALDWLEAREDVEPGRTVFIGMSLGGYYAARAAAAEPRIAACVVWSGLTDFKEVIMRPHMQAQRVAQVPPRVLAGVARVGGRVHPALRQLRDFPALYTWGHNQLMWILGVEATDAAERALEGFTLTGHLEHLRCPLLIVHTDADHLVPVTHAYRLFAGAASEQKHLKVFTREDGADDHCMLGNLPRTVQYMSDWVEEAVANGLPRPAGPAATPSGRLPPG